MASRSPAWAASTILPAISLVNGSSVPLSLSDRQAWSNAAPIARTCSGSNTTSGKAWLIATARSHATEGPFLPQMWQASVRSPTPFEKYFNKAEYIHAGQQLSALGGLFRAQQPLRGAFQSSIADDSLGGSDGS